MLAAISGTRAVFILEMSIWTGTPITMQTARILMPMMILLLFILAARLVPAKAALLLFAETFM